MEDGRSEFSTDKRGARRGALTAPRRHLRNESEGIRRFRGTGEDPKELVFVDGRTTVPIQPTESVARLSHVR